jgi:hypothetical protein
LTDPWDLPAAGGKDEQPGEAGKKIIPEAIVHNPEPLMNVAIAAELALPKYLPK